MAQTFFEGSNILNIDANFSSSITNFYSSFSSSATTSGSVTPPRPPLLSKLLFTYGFDSTSTENLLDLKCDSSDNVYALFFYNLNFNVRNLNGTSTGRTYTSVIGTTGVAIVKYNSNGNVIWSVRILTQNNSIGGIKLDSNGNVYGFGQRGANTLSLYNANDVLTGVTVGYTGGGDAVIFKYDTNGNPLWATRIANTGGESIVDAEIDNSGNVYLIGINNTNSKAVYNSDGSVFKNLLYAGGNDTCIVKYNSSGFGQWAATIIGAGNENTGRVRIDLSGNICIIGQSNSNPLNLYNSNDTLFGTLTATTNDVYIVRYNPTTGNVVNGYFVLSGAADDSISDVFVDSSKNFYLTGVYSTTSLNINNLDGTSSGITLTNSGNYDAYIIKYNSNGIAQWATRCAGTVYDETRRISVDYEGSVYVIGIYQSNPVTIYNSNGDIFKSFNLVTANDSFIVKFNSSGIGQWATNITGSGDDVLNGLTVDSNGNVYCGGTYNSNPITIYNVNGTVYSTASNTGVYDTFLIRNIQS